MIKEYLGNIVSLQRGYDLTHSQMSGGPYPVAGSNGIIGYHNLHRSNKPCLTIGRSGSAGKVHFYEDYVWPHNTALYVTDFKGNCPYYVYCLLSCLHLDDICGSSVVPSLDRKVVYKLKVDFEEDVNKQEKIAAIIKSIDAKISLNRSIIKELEEMAKEIYDYWFVQFDFPDTNGRPYKSTGGTLVYNNVLKREIPVGWKVKSVNDITSSSRGVSYDKSDLLKDDSGVLILRGNNIQDNKLIYDNNTAYVPSSLVSEEQRIKKHDIVMTMSSGSKEHIGKCIMFQNDSAHSYGAFLNKFTPLQESQYLLFLFMCSTYFKKKIKVICNGTGINNLTNKTFDDISIVFPPSDILNAFNHKVQPLFDKIGLLEDECIELSSISRKNLPLLMTGQVKIK